MEELLSADPNDGVYFPVSCQEYADNGATQNGSYRVQPNKIDPRNYIQYQLKDARFFTRNLLSRIKNIKYKILSFIIDCEFHDGKGSSVFYPQFSQPTQFTATPNGNDGCEAPGCYEDHLTYSFGSKTLA